LYKYYRVEKESRAFTEAATLYKTPQNRKGKGRMEVTRGGLLFYSFKVYFSFVSAGGGPSARDHICSLTLDSASAWRLRQLKRLEFKKKKSRKGGERGGRMEVTRGGLLNLFPLSALERGRRLATTPVA
jgi:hypothetical protein